MDPTAFQLWESKRSGLSLTGIAGRTGSELYALAVPFQQRLPPGTTAVRASAVPGSVRFFAEAFAATRALHPAGSHLQKTRVVVKRL